MVGRLKQGEIWVSDLRPGGPVLDGKLRPVVIVQADRVSSGLATVLVAPLTSQKLSIKGRIRPLVKAGGKLKQDSRVMVDQIRPVPLNRFGGGSFHRLSPEEWDQVKSAIVAVFGLV